MALTRRQKQVFDFLITFISGHGYSPSFEEIGAGLGLSSLATVHKHLQTLEKKGSAFVIEDADDVRFDARSGRVLVGGG